MRIKKFNESINKETIEKYFDKDFYNAIHAITDLNSPISYCTNEGFIEIETKDGKIVNDNFEHLSYFKYIKPDSDYLKSYPCIYIGISVQDEDEVDHYEYSSHNNIEIIKYYSEMIEAVNESANRLVELGYKVSFGSDIRMSFVINVYTDKVNLYE